MGKTVVLAGCEMAWDPWVGELLWGLGGGWTLPVAGPQERGGGCWVVRWLGPKLTGEVELCSVH